MDYSESTKVVFQRIEKLDPENVSKIIGYLLLKDHGELEMIRLAFGSDNVIQSLIDKIKKELDSLCPKPAVSSPVSPNNPQPKPSSSLPTKFTPFTPAASLWSSAPVPSENCQRIVPQVPTGQHLVQNFQYIPLAFVEPPPPPSAGGGYVLHNQQRQIVLVDDQMQSCNLASGSYFHAAPNHCPPMMPDQSCPHFPELTAQICLSFNQGYCKYGGNCRFLHILRMENGCFMVLNPPKTEEDYVLSHASLKQLEIEMIGLLKGRRGIPVSISSLPIFYYDKYGRVLQVEGYCMEILGQGKVRFTLTQLIAQMTKGIRLIDRPHGRQSIILVEDIPRYVRLIDKQNENESSSCQVYLTFPPHSMFSEEDVYNYFNNFGPVQEVRLPNQEKRMFGFVTFVYPETVALVLTKTNPHFICGAKVLVKPYRIKPMLVDRKPEEQVQYPIQVDPYLPDAQSRPSSTKECENMKFQNKQLIEGYEQSVELEKKHIFVGQTSDGSSFIEGVWSNGCNSEDRVFHIKTCNYNQDSFEELNLPESPFAFDVVHGVSPLM